MEPYLFFKIVVLIMDKKKFQLWLTNVLFSQQMIMNKINLGELIQGRGRGFMNGWKTIGTHHVNSKLTSTDKNFKCKLTLDINITNYCKKNCFTPKPNEHNPKMKREYFQGAKQDSNIIIHKKVFTYIHVQIFFYM